jgi:hypothetical protein
VEKCVLYHDWAEENLFSQDDFSGSSHVWAGLSGTFVGSCLESNDGFASSQLLFSELSLVLFWWPWSQEWSAEFWVSVGLIKNRKLWEDPHWEVETYSASYGKNSLGDESDVFLIPQIVGVEQIDITHAPVDCSSLELWNVIHHFIVAARNVDLLDEVWFELVHQLAQENSVAEWILEGFFGKLFTGDGLDPSLSFLLLFNIALSSNL